MNDQDYKNVAVPIGNCASEEISNALSLLCSRTDKIAGIMINRLTCIAREQPPIGRDGSELVKPYPPLFASYRDYIQSISVSLSHMEDILDRLELP